MIDLKTVIAERAEAVDGEGIRRWAEAARRLPGAINVSVGQPDFDVPDRVKRALSASVTSGKNGYTPAAGIPELNDLLQAQFGAECRSWSFGGPQAQHASIVCSGVTSAIFFSLLAVVAPGGEVIVADPEFFHYAEIISLLGGKPVLVETYPDFQLSSERVAPYLSAKTKALIFSSPGNPTGTVMTASTCAELASLADKNNFLLIADEIYRDFYYGAPGERCPSIADFSNDVLVLRGLSKSHGMTGWRVGFAFGPTELIGCMIRLQGLLTVSGPSTGQYAALEALRTPIDDIVNEYRARRKAVRDELLQSNLGVASQQSETEGGFYFFVKVPERLGMNASEFCQEAWAKSVILIPGSVFSRRDTHFRLSLTRPQEVLREAVRRLSGVGR